MHDIGEDEIKLTAYKNEQMSKRKKRSNNSPGIIH